MLALYALNARTGKTARYGYYWTLSLLTSAPSIGGVMGVSGLMVKGYRYGTACTPCTLGRKFGKTLKKLDKIRGIVVNYI